MTNNNLDNQSTFDLAFGLATGVYDEATKLQILSIIKGREQNNNNNIPSFTNQPPLNNNQSSSIPKPKTKLPVKGSKTESIYLLLKEGKNQRDVSDSLKAKKIKVTPSEIYRVGRLYFPERFLKND